MAHCAGTLTTRLPSFAPRPRAVAPPRSATNFHSLSRFGLAGTVIHCSNEKTPRDDLQLKNVEVNAAESMLQAGSHRYLDVRAPEVFATGNVPGSHNIPYYLPGSDRVKNTSFEREVLSIFNKDDGIIVGCGTGNRSALAASDLLAAGFKNVYNMLGGYRAIANKTKN